MSPKPIEQAHDAILRLSLPALLRAARRAREVAAQTGTCIVVSRDGVIEHIAPKPTTERIGVREATTDYGDKQP